MPTAAWASEPTAPTDESTAAAAAAAGATGAAGGGPNVFGDRRRLSLAHNSLINLMGTALGLVLGLVVTPYVVVRLGLEAFGFVALISAFSQYAALFDFGVGTTIMRAIGHHDERADIDAIRRQAASGLWSSAASGTILIVAVGLVIAALPADAFGALPAGWKVAVLAVAFSVACTSVASVFQAFPSGMGRWDLTNISSVANQVVYSVAVVVALAFERNLEAVAFATAASGVTGLLASYVIYRRRWHLRLTPRAAARGELWGLWSYGLSTQTVGLTTIINAQADKPILLLFASLKFVGLYEIGSRVVVAIRSLAITAFGPLSAHAARMYARGGRAQVGDVYESSYRSTMLLGLVPLTMLFALCYVFVLMWVGPAYRTAGIIALILASGYAVNLATGAGTSIAMGAGRADLDRNYSAIGFGLNVVLTIGLGLLVGRWGVIAATALGLVISSFWLLHSVDRWLDTSILTLRNIGGGRASTCLLALAVGLGAAATAVAMIVPIDSRPVAAAVLVGTGLVFALIWLSAAIRSGSVTLPVGVRRLPAAVAARVRPRIGSIGFGDHRAALAGPAGLDGLLGARDALPTVGARPPLPRGAGDAAGTAPPSPDAPPRPPLHSHGPEAPVTADVDDAAPSALPVTVIVISHNGATRIGETLGALARQTIPRERFEVIVVDDASADGTSEIAQAHGARVVALPANLGPGGARDAGVRAARTDLLAFIDDDCTAAPDWLAQMLGAFADPAVDGVGGRIEPVTRPGLIAGFFAVRNPWSPLSDEYLRSSDRWFRLMLYLRSVARADTDPRGAGLFSVAGGNMAFRRSSLDSIGGFATSHRVGEETELCRRLHNRPGGATIVYRRAAEVGHRFDSSLPGVLGRALRYGGGTARMARTHDDVHLVAFPFPLLVLGLAVTAITARRRAAAGGAALAPLALYVGWTVRAVRRRDLRELAFPYLQLLMETATMAGELAEIRSRRHSDGAL